MHRSVVAAVALVSLVSCVSAPRPASTLAPCTLPDIAAAAMCGTIDVAENRGQRGGRKVALNVAVVKAKERPAAADPIVFLAGGPGQGATEIAHAVVPELAPLMRTRDLVLVDQRGTGKSNQLTCAGGFDLVEPHRRDDLARCAATLQQRADLTQYTTGVAAEDLREVLDRLGYQRVNLVGGSYGTRAAFVFLRRYPERVRTAVLRAVAPPGFNIISGGSINFSRQAEQLLAHCASDASCARAYPRLREDIHALRARVAATPARITVRDETFDVTSALLQQTLYAMLLNTATRQMLPALITSAASGDFTRLGPAIHQVRTAVYGAIPVGLYLSVVCSEDAPNVSEADRAMMRELFGDLGETLFAACEVWPRGTMAPELRQFDPVAVPALLVSGEADPATPPSSGIEAMKQLRNARHLVAPATSHVPMFPGCIRALVEQFVVSGGAATIDDACVRELRWPPFVVAR